MDTRTKSNAEFRNEVSKTLSRVNEALSRHETSLDHMNRNFTQINAAIQTMMADLQALHVTQTTNTSDKEFNPFVQPETSQNSPNS